MNDEVGCLIDGFDTSPTIAMPHGRPYYGALIEQYGYRKGKDLWSYPYPVTELQPRRRDWYERIHAMPNLRMREFETKHLRRDIRIAAEIFNNAWQAIWGFVPISMEEAGRLAADLAPFAKPGLTAIVEVDRELAAMVLAVPNLTALIHDVNGQRYPFGWAKIWWRLRRRPKEARVILLGIKRKYCTRAGRACRDAQRGGVCAGETPGLRVGGVGLGARG